jgi:hypothetical protein
MGLFTTYKGLEAQGNVALKSLKFNNDDSFNAQPFIQTPIPGDDGIVSIVNNKNTGFVNTINEASAGFLNLNDKLKISPTVSTLATGIYRSAVDVVRLSKFMTTPSGLEFIAKQELLSLMAPRTETSGILNGGIYNPISTLVQAGVNIAGVHLPTYQNSAAKIKFGKKSSEKTKEKGKSGELSAGKTYGRLIYERGLSNPNEKLDNRLTSLYSKHVGTQYAYNSGVHTSLYRYIGGPGSIMGVGYTSIDFQTDPSGNPIRTMGPNFIYPTGDYNTPRTFEAVYTHPEITLYETVKGYQSLETKYGLGDPGRKKFIGNAVDGDWVPHRDDIKLPLDKINGHLIYSSKENEKNIQDKTSALKDLVTFRIGVISLGGLTDSITNPSIYYMHFRSFIDSFSDSYSSDWSSQTYMGRGEKLYKYNSFDRNINMSFTVAAQSQAEMMGMYQKLNYLASTTAPQYTPYGYMTGVITKMTLGKYLNNVHCKIDSIEYEIPEDSPWMVDNPDEGISNNKYNQLPFIIKVRMRFTPLHNFRPELVKDLTDENGNTGIGHISYLASPNDSETRAQFSPTQTLEIGTVYAGSKNLPTTPSAETYKSRKLFTDKDSANLPAAQQGFYEQSAEYNWEDVGNDIKKGAKAVEKRFKPVQSAIRKGNIAVKNGIGEAYNYIKDKLKKDSKPPIAG